jgi:hypothetical protein
MTTDAIEFVKRTVSPMAAFTSPFVSSIVGILSAEKGEHVGSAFRCILAGRRVLVTAKQVFDQAASSPLGAGWTSERGRPPARLPEAPSLVGPTDLAAFVLDRPPEGEGIDWWREDRIDTDIEARGHDYLFLQGFPGVRSRFLFGELHPRRRGRGR